MKLKTRRQRSETVMCEDVLLVLPDALLCRQYIMNLLRWVEVEILARCHLSSLVMPMQGP